MNSGYSKIWWLSPVIMFLVSCSGPRLESPMDDLIGEVSDVLPAPSDSRHEDSDVSTQTADKDNSLPEVGRTPPDAADSLDCAIAVIVPEFNSCACTDELPASQCGRVMADGQVILAQVSITCEDGIETPAIGRVVLSEVLPSGQGKNLLDYETIPEPGTNSYELQLDISATDGGWPHYVGETRNIILEVAAYSVPVGEQEQALSGKAVVNAFVDVDGPQILLHMPNPGAAGASYIQELPWEFDAGDVGTGLQSASVMLDWQVIASVSEPTHPFSMETYEGISPFTVLSNSAATFRVLAWDCLGNKTSAHVQVELLGAPPSGGIKTVLCPPDTGKGNMLSTGHGDADESRLDLLVSAENGLLVGWGQGTGTLFEPFVRVGEDEKRRFVDAHFIKADSDPHPDIIALQLNTGSNSEGRVVLYRQNTEAGQGLRTFALAEERKVGPHAVELETCDLDGDGSDDVVAAHPGEQFSAALLYSTGKEADSNDEDSYFSAPVFLSGVTDASDLKCADVGGDHLPDVVLTRGFSNLVSVFLNLGSGQFGMALNSQLVKEDAEFFDTGHFNDDDILDLVVYEKELGVSYALTGLGTGYFEVEQFPDTVENWKSFGQQFVSRIIGTKVESSANSSPGIVVMAGSGASSLVASDLDNDGYPDLALSDETGKQIQIFYSTGYGSFKEGPFSSVGFIPHALVSGDFDISGSNDLAFLQKGQCTAGVLVTKDSDSYQLPCSGEGQCLGDGDGNCNCHCACVCSGQGLCGWKCEWRPAADNCGQPLECPTEMSPKCNCDTTCQCECSETGVLACPWKMKMDYQGSGTCDQFPGCAAEPEDPACACADSCKCGCSQTGSPWCQPVSFFAYQGDPDMCQGEGQCLGDGQCEGLGDCEEPVPDKGQCVCTCGCQCNCECQCFCTGNGASYCLWNCEEDCTWDCHVEVPQPYLPWSTSSELPLPVKPDFEQGRLRPVMVRVGDVDLDGIPDVVVATELTHKSHCDVFEFPTQANVRPFVTFLGTGQTLTTVESANSFSSHDMTDSLVGFAIEDMDGHGYPDLVLATTSWANSFSEDSVNLDIMRGATAITLGPSWEDHDCTSASGPAGTFVSLSGYIFPGHIGAMAVGQINNDSLTDIVLAADEADFVLEQWDAPDRVALLETRADGSWSTLVPPPTPYYNKCIPFSAIANPAIEPPACLGQQWWNNECWGACVPDDSVDSPNVGMGPIAIAIGDVNNDWVPDVVVGYKISGDITLLRGTMVDGQYVLSAVDKPPQQLSLGASPADIVLGEVDGDGWLDLIAVVDGSLAIAWGIDGTNFQVPKVVHKTLDGTVLQGLRVETGDVNNDGRADVVLLSRINSEIYVFTSTGDKVLKGPSVYATGDSPVDLAVHDMNQDGCADFVLAVEDTRSVAVILSKDCL